MYPRFGDQNRPYSQSHPWITFTFNLNDLGPLDFARLGSALSKADDIAGVPLPPKVADDLNELFLVKGIHATTQIEGNSLSEEQVHARVKGDLPLPDSQEYLGIEIDNILAACNLVGQELAFGNDMRIARSRIEQFNGLVLRDLPEQDGVVPGKVRTKGVEVGTVYRGAPAADCAFLLDQLCDWLTELPQDAGPDWRRSIGLIKAILAHLYLAWIHPFGDGNGRTARLVEVQLLLEAGFPWPTCHLLSNYYNKTRSLYYQVLRETSQGPPYGSWKFVSYALRGFVEELEEQLKVIRSVQLRMAWINFVHERVGGSTVTAKRRRDLVLELPDNEMTAVSKIQRLTPDLAAYYATRTRKTISRDVNALVSEGLLVRGRSGVQPNIGRMRAFLPLRCSADQIEAPSSPARSKPTPSKPARSKPTRGKAA